MARSVSSGACPASGYTISISILRSKAFLGFWLDTAALFKSDGKRLLEVANQGLASDEHTKFVRTLEAGRIIAEGEPEHVRNDPIVIASYLGTDLVAIERSNGGRRRASQVSVTRR